MQGIQDIRRRRPACWLLWCPVVGNGTKHVVFCWQGGRNCEHWPSRYLNGSSMLDPANARTSRTWRRSGSTTSEN